MELNVPVLKQKRNTLSSSASTNLIESNSTLNKDKDGYKSSTIGRKSSVIVSSNKPQPQWNDNSEIKPDDSYLNPVGDYTGIFIYLFIHSFTYLIIYIFFYFFIFREVYLL